MRQANMRQDLSFVRDAVAAYTVALALKPDLFPARAHLTLGLLLLSETKRARGEAIRALRDVDNYMAHEMRSKIPSRFLIPPAEL